MPATEQTLYNQKLLHVIFAVSGVALLASTIWMFAADHMREWKRYQRNFRQVELQYNLWRQASADQERLQDHGALSSALLTETSREIDAELLARFRQEIESAGLIEVSFDRIESEAKELSTLAKDAADKRAAASKADDSSKQADQGDAENPADGESEPPQGDAKADSDQSRRQAKEADEEAIEAEQKAAKVRAKLLNRLRRLIARVRFREAMAERKLKFTRAEFDTSVANLGLGVRDGRDNLEQLQRQVDQWKSQVDDLTLKYQDANTHRKMLEQIVGEITAAEDKARKDLAENQAALDQLKTAYRDRRSTFFAPRYPGLGKRWLEMPILDAFGSPLRIETLWNEDNKINYNFVYVRRFDRCTTCHQAMQKTLPGQGSSPAYIQEKHIDLVLQTPDESDIEKLREEHGKVTLADAYGIRVEQWRLFSRDSVAVTMVRNQSRGAQAGLAAGEVSLTPRDSEEIRNAALHPQLAAWEVFADTRAGLMLGDVIEEINGDAIRKPAEVQRKLLESVEWGKPITIRIRRGLAHPYATHPRLDLMVGDLSPHPMGVFGCTACHEGQSTATAFKWASHSPNDPIQRKAWSDKYSWFDNHHWIFPQYPKRFMESGCLKCHHDVLELQKSERFPEAPAPKVVHGYRLLQKYGCFGCHEINGFDGPHKRVGPDLRAEPGFFATALQFKSLLPQRFDHFVPQYDKLNTGLAPLRQQSGILQAEKEKLNAQKAELLKGDAEAAKAQIEQIDTRIADIDAQLAKLNEQIAPLQEEMKPLLGHLERLNESRQLADNLAQHPEDTAARHRLMQLLDEDDKSQGDKYGKTFSPAAYALVDLLKDVETPGALRKTGPSLRYAARKMGGKFLYDWIRNPQNFRPGTRMPRVFGLWGHLQDEPGSLEQAKRFEPIEILGIVTYLQQRSQSLEYLTPPNGIAQSTPEEKIARGKKLFQSRGCLACHAHKDFADAEDFRSPDDIAQGPDLSRIADKLTADGDSGRNHRRWLYSWIKEPTRYHARTLMPNLFLDPIMTPVLDESGKPKLDEQNKPIEKLIDPADDIVDYLLSASGSDWHPDSAVTELDGEQTKALHDLTLEHLKDAFYEKRAQEYLQTGIPLDKREGLKPAEEELLGEIDDRQRLLYVGRKSIAKYGCYGCHDIPGFEGAKPIGTTLADWGRKDTSKLAIGHVLEYLGLHGDHGGGHGHADHDHAEHAKHDENLGAGKGEPPSAFYADALLSGHRSGFLDQKLREPRSYDYRGTENIKYNARLRMPQFNMTAADREAMITFILGLVAEPPAAKFIYHPDPYDEAIQQGRQVLSKYNCGGCHILDLEKWEIEFGPDDFGPQQPVVTFPFLKPHFTPQQLKASAKPDRRGRFHATLVGLPAVAPDGRALINDDEGFPLEEGETYVPRQLEYPFVLWKPTVLNGNPYEVGGVSVKVFATMLKNRQPAHGGMLTKYLLPHVIKNEEIITAGVIKDKGGEAMGWLPPPLHNEGQKVNADWLHDFLLEPYLIRPAVDIRMPKFNMSSREATQLVNYFAARNKVEFPYQHQQPLPGLSAGGPDSKLADFQRRKQAMNIVADAQNGCVKCHYVSDFIPSGSKRVQGPDLSRVHRRLRPEYMRKWIADPKLILPYPTAMLTPMIYKPDDPHLGALSQDLFPGTSIQQIDALVDLLSNYDEYAKGRSLVRPLVKQNPPPDAPGAAPGAAPDAGGTQ